MAFFVTVMNYCLILSYTNNFLSLFYIFVGHFPSHLYHNHLAVYSQDLLQMYKHCCIETFTKECKKSEMSMLYTELQLAWEKDLQFRQSCIVLRVHN